ncbi:MAG: hypothetical protein LBR44_00460 [Clostridiales Family XIII bacterium]|jgi:hypothetical protein|nr:hypothetical protein [Clostridiales Family XIII bacterium]
MFKLNMKKVVIALAVVLVAGLAVPMLTLAEEGAAAPAAPPAEAAQEAPPESGGAEAPPAEGGTETPPAEGGQETAPGAEGGGSQDAAQEGGSGQTGTPAEAGGSEAAPSDSAATGAAGEGDAAASTAETDPSSQSGDAAAAAQASAQPAAAQQEEVEAEGSDIEPLSDTWYDPVTVNKGRTTFSSVNIGYGTQSAVELWSAAGARGEKPQGDGSAMSYTYDTIKASITGATNAFEIVTAPASSVGESGNTSCTVRVKTGLAAGTYDATLVVTYNEVFTFYLLGQSSSGHTPTTVNYPLRVTVNKLGQSALSISNNLPTAYGSTATVSVSGGDGSAARTLQSTNTAVATVSGGTVSGSVTNFTVTIAKGTGSYTLKANRAGDSTYLAATEVTRSATAAKINQPDALTLSGSLPTEYNSSSEVTVSGGNGEGSYTLASSDTKVAKVESVGTGKWKVTVTGANGTYTLTYGRNGDDNYNAKSAVTGTTTTVQTEPSISTFPSTPPVTYGTKLSAMPLTGKATDPNTSAEVAGSFKWVAPETVPTYVNTGYAVKFVPTDTGYKQLDLTVKPTIYQAVPRLGTAPTVSDITYGQALSASTFTAGSGQALNPVDSSMTVTGTFSWQNGNTVLPVTGPNQDGGLGRQPVLFTTTDPNYVEETVIVYVRPKVNKADIVVEAWPTTSGSYTYGVQLSGINLDGGAVKSALDATLGVAPTGTFYWKVPATYPTVANSGPGSTGYVVAFQIDDATKANYNAMTQTKLVTLPKITPRQLIGTWKADDKIYNGQTKATVSFTPQPSGSGSLVPGDAAEDVLGAITANFAIYGGGQYIPDANAEEDKDVIITNMKLLGAVPNYSLPADLAAYVNDPVANPPALTKATISKADGGPSGTVLVKAAADRPAKLYTKSLNDFIPNAAGSPGQVSYRVGAKTDPDAIMEDPSMNAGLSVPGLDPGFVNSNGTLKMPVNEVAWSGPHSDATFRVTVRSQNYTDVQVDVTVHMYPLIEAHLWIAQAPDKIYDGIPYGQALADSTITVPDGYDGAADVSTGTVPQSSIEYWYEGFGEPAEGGTDYGPSTTPPTGAGEYKVWAVATGDYTGQSVEDYFIIRKRTITVSAPSVEVALNAPLPLPTLNADPYKVTYSNIAAADKGKTLLATEAVAAYGPYDLSQADWYKIGFDEFGGTSAELTQEWAANYVLQHMNGVLTVGDPSDDGADKIPLQFTAVQVNGKNGLTTTTAIRLDFLLDGDAPEGASLDLLELEPDSIILSGDGVVKGAGLYEVEGTAGGGMWRCSVTGSFENPTLAKVNVNLPKTSPYKVVSKNVEVELYRDAKPPHATVSYKSRPFLDFLNTLTFGLFFQDSTLVTIKATDEGSDVEVDYCLVPGAPEASEPGAGWTRYVSPFSVNGDSKFSLWVRATDAEGNRQVYKDGVVIYTDVSTHSASASSERFVDADAPTTRIAMNGNKVARLVNLTGGSEEVLPASAWSAVYNVDAGDYIDLKGVWLRTLPQGRYTLRAEYAPQGEAYVADLRGDGDADINEAPSTTLIALTIRALDQGQLDFIGLSESRTFTYGVDTGFTVRATGGSGTGSVRYEIIDESDPGNIAEINPVTGVVKLLKPGTFRIQATKAADSDYAEATAETDVITFERATPAVAVAAAGDKTQLTLSAAVTGVEGNTPLGTIDFLYYPSSGTAADAKSIATGLELSRSGKISYSCSLAAKGLSPSTEYIFLADYTPAPASAGLNNPAFADLGTDVWYQPSQGESSPYQAGKKDQAPLIFVGPLLNDLDAEATATALIYGGGILDSSATAKLHVEGGSTGGEVTWWLVSGPEYVTVTPEGMMALGAPGSAIVHATMAGNDEYNAVSGTFIVTIGKAVPLVTDPAGSPVTYGQRLEHSTPSGLVTGVDGEELNGEWHWQRATVFPDIDDGEPSIPLTYEAIFLPTLSDAYTSVDADMPVPVNPATPIVNKNPAASAIKPGEKLGDAVFVDQGQVTFLLGSVFVTVPGSWGWDPGDDFTTPYNVEGPQTAAALFTPSDPLRFTTANGTGSFEVSSKKPLVLEPPTVHYLRGAGRDPSAPNPTEISYGKYFITYLELEGGGVALADDVDTPIPGKWSFTNDERRADQVGTISGVPVVFTPDDPQIPAAYATVDVKVCSALLRLEDMPPPQDIVFGQTLDEMEAQTGFLSMDGWVFTGAFGESVVGDIGWFDGDVMPEDEDALELGVEAIFHPYAGTSLADNWLARYEPMAFGLDLHVTPSRWDEMVAKQAELEYWIYYITVGATSLGGHEENYDAKAVDAADAVLAASEQLTNAPRFATERQTNEMLEALIKALESLKHDHPLLSMDTGSGPKDTVIAKGTEVSIRIKGNIYDVTQVTIDGIDIYEHASGSNATDSADLFEQNQDIGHLSKGSAIVTFDAGFIDTLAEGPHAVRIEFEDFYRTGVGEGVFKVDWPEIPSDDGEDGGGGGGGGGGGADAQGRYRTGDDAYPGLWAVAAILAALSLLLLLWRRRVA